MTPDPMADGNANPFRAFIEANQYSMAMFPSMGKALGALGMIAAGVGVLLYFGIGLHFGDQPLAVTVTVSGIALTIAGAAFAQVPAVVAKLTEVFNRFFPPAAPDPVPWKTDFKGRERGTASELAGDWKGAVASILTSLLWAVVILGIFWAVMVGTPATDWGMMYLIVGLTILSTFWAIGKTALRALRAFRFGRNEIQYDVFPFFTGEQLSAHIKAGPVLASQRAEAILRCVRRYKVRNRSRPGMEVVFEQTQQIHFNSMGEAEIRFDLPADAPSTRIPARIYENWRWAVEVKADLPGVDYRDSFDVPVYSRTSEQSEQLRYGTSRPVAAPASLSAATFRPKQFLSTAVFLLLGIGLIGPFIAFEMGTRDAYLAVMQRDWVSVPGKILRSDIYSYPATCYSGTRNNRRSYPCTLHDVRVLYAYTHQKQAFRGEAIEYQRKGLQPSKDRAIIEILSADLKPGPATVYLNPADPREAVLRLGTREGPGFKTAVYFAVIWLLVFLGAALVWHRMGLFASAAEKPRGSRR